MAGQNAPFDHLTADNTGPAVIVVIYSLASVSSGIAVIRFWLQAIRSIPFGIDDGAYIVANLWAISSTILWTLAVNSGLGQRMAALGASNIDKFFKFEYAAQFAEIVAMFCAKVAFTFLLDRIVPGRQWTKTAALSFVGAWAAFSLFALAFQCPFPRPWVFEPAQCPTHGRLLYPIIAFNAIIDVGLSFWIVPSIWRLRMRLKDRILVLILFCLRVCILVPTITEMGMMHLFLDNIDQTRVGVNRAILNQITVYVSVMTAAIPRTNQFLSQLHTNRTAFTLPDFEIIDAGQTTEPKPDASPQVVPQHDSVLSTTADSESSSHPNEDRVSSPGSVTIRREIVVVENNKGRDC